MEERINISVYGSLLTELGNHRVLGRHVTSGNASLVGKDEILGFKLYPVAGRSFPGVKRTSVSTDRVKVEVYNVNAEALASVRALEGYRVGGRNTFYDEVVAETVNHGNVSVYKYVPEIGNMEAIENGDWKSYLGQ